MDHLLDREMEKVQDDTIPASVIIARQRDQIQAQNETIAELHREIARLQRMTRSVGQVYDWNNNVRANGEYHE